MRVLAISMVVCMPILLTLTGVRLVMSEAFLRWEYNRPGFPADRYGFTTEERLDYGPYGIRYLLRNEDISYLADLEYQGEPLFRQKELQHMEDVQTVTRAALRVQIILLIITIASATALGWSPHTRAKLRQALTAGGMFTLAAISTLVVLMATSWDVFFDNFHAIFFEGDTWLFYTSDSLIRLYPEQFWLDAALTIGALTVVGAVIAIGGVWWWERHASHTPIA